VYAKDDTVDNSIGVRRESKESRVPSDGIPFSVEAFENNFKDVFFRVDVLHSSTVDAFRNEK
jgi:hypothetical protein